MNSENNKIAKNTLLLYCRMAVTMWISLYTSRMLLNILGVEDYGIYNIVGGVTAIMWSFIGALSTSTTRHITFELGRQNTQRLKKVFGISLSLHAILSLGIIIISETAGIWFVYNKLVLPPARLEAAIWVFQFSLFSLIISIMSVPFNACIIAHEKMSAYAYISIIDTLLKLISVYIILILPYDKLKVYAACSMLVQTIIQSIYMVYCNKSFSEVKLHFGYNKELMKEMGTFALWNLIGSGGALVMQQGHSIILNQFFGPVVNAAKGIAGQVLGMVGKFTSNFQVAVNPQIFKSYAAGNIDYMHKLIFTSSRYSFYLFIIIVIPVIIETPFLLEVWLKQIPANTIDFLKISLLTAATNILASPLVTAAQATGKIRKFQIIESIVLLSVLPFSWFVLSIGEAPIAAFYVYFIFHAIAVFARVFMLRKMIGLSGMKYLKKVIYPISIVSLIAFIISYTISNIMPNNLIFHLLSLVQSFLFTLSTIFVIGISAKERSIAKEKAQYIICTFKNKFKK